MSCAAGVRHLCLHPTYSSLRSCMQTFSRSCSRRPLYDIDGGRQSPFENEDDYDYDSCCGPDVGMGGGLVLPPTPSVPQEPLGSNRSSMELQETNCTGAAQPQSLQVKADPSYESILVNATIFGSNFLADLQHRRRPACSPAPHGKKLRLAQDVPFCFGR